MVRPCCLRRVGAVLHATFFKPAGQPASTLDVVVLLEDELEALRLADWEGLYQEEAAARMAVSRATFGRILTSAHKKVAEALVHGKALRIENNPAAVDDSAIVSEEESGPSEPGRGKAGCGCGHGHPGVPRRMHGYCGRRNAAGPLPETLEEEEALDGVTSAQEEKQS